MGPRTCSFILAFAQLSASAYACEQNTVARSEFIGNCQTKAAANRLGKAGIPDPLLDEVDDSGKSYDCAKIYEGRIAACEAIEKRKLESGPTIETAGESRVGVGLEGSASIQHALSPTAQTTPAAEAAPAAKKPAAASPKSSPGATTDYSAATDENSRGAQRTSAAVDEVGRADTEIRNMANHSADVAVKRAAQNVRQSRSGSSSTKAAAKQDQELAQKGKAALKAGKEFPDELAKKASDEMVRQHLKVVSRATHSEPVLAKEENRLLGQLSELLKLASLTQNRGNAMGSEAAAMRSPNAEEKGRGSVSAADGAPAVRGNNAGLTGAGSASGKRGPDDSGEEDGSSSPVKVAEGAGDNEAQAKRRSLRSSLKERLRKLLDANHAEATAGVAQFEQELSPEMGSTAHDGEVSSRDQAIKQFLSESRRDADEPFAMPGAGGEASAFLQASETELGTLRGGILTEESASLFTRVSEAYRARHESFRSD